MHGFCFLGKRGQLSFYSVLPLSHSLCLLQPQNILLTSAQPLGDIRIVDFGLSRRVDRVSEVREILGTPEYVGESDLLHLHTPNPPHVQHYYCKNGNVKSCQLSIMTRRGEPKACVRLVTLHVTVDLLVTPSVLENL